MIRPTQLLVEFCFLQFMDFLSTWAFLVHHVPEGNFLVRWPGHPFEGLAVAKLTAIALGLTAWYLGRQKALRYGSAFYALVVVWNLVAIIRAGA